MGLDQYLFGEKFHWRNFNHPETDRREDSFEVRKTILDLGYWGKHPDLHGYIVENFADGVDECQKIELSEDNLRQIIEAVKKRQLPKTEGFFFGSSQNDDEQIAKDVQILEKALNWLQETDQSPVVLEESSLPKLEGFSMTAVTLRELEEADKQKVTRTVYYEASW